MTADSHRRRTCTVLGIDPARMSVHSTSISITNDKMKTIWVVFFSFAHFCCEGCSRLVCSYIKQLLPSHARHAAKVSRYKDELSPALPFRGSESGKETVKATGQVQSLGWNQALRFWQWPTSVRLPVRLCHLSLRETFAGTPSHWPLWVWMTLATAWNPELRGVLLEFLVCTYVLQIDIHKPLIISSYQAA